MKNPNNQQRAQGSGRVAAAANTQHGRFARTGRGFRSKAGGFAKRRERVPKEILGIYAVSNTNKQGRRRSIVVVSCVGDQKGRIGIGRAKSQNLTDASRTSQRRAINNQRSYDLCQKNGVNLTHRVSATSNGTTVMLAPRSSGGRICPVKIQKILKMLGVKNAVGNIIGSSSSSDNVIKATLACLQKQETDAAYAKKLGIPISKLIERKRSNSYMRLTKGVKK
jgi:small subunit ribosomal protein S5